MNWINNFIMGIVVTVVVVTIRIHAFGPGRH